MIVGIIGILAALITGFAERITDHSTLDYVFRIMCAGIGFCGRRGPACTIAAVPFSRYENAGGIPGKTNIALIAGRIIDIAEFALIAGFPGVIHRTVAAAVSVAVAVTIARICRSGAYAAGSAGIGVGAGFAIVAVAGFFGCRGFRIDGGIAYLT